MKQKYTITLDQYIVEEIKKKGIALSTMLNQLLTDKLHEIKKNEQVSQADIDEAYETIKAKHSDKTIKQLDILINAVNNSEMDRKKKEITFQALQRLKAMMAKQEESK